MEQKLSKLDRLLNGGTILVMGCAIILGAYHYARLVRDVRTLESKVANLEKTIKRNNSHIMDLYDGGRIIGAATNILMDDYNLRHHITGLTKGESNP